MEGYEFAGEVQRLHALAGFLTSIRLDDMERHLAYAESVAPLFERAQVGHNSPRLTALRRFIAKAREFQRECAAAGAELEAAENGVRQLPAGSSPEGA